MRGLTLGILAAVAGVALWLWGFGGADVIGRWANATQRDVQNAMAASLRALKTGQPGALFALWGLCFTYGFVHAAGPGHGKIVIGGYGVAARVTARRLAGLAVVSSLAQALAAVLLVYLAVWVFGWGRAQMTAIADRTLAPLSYAMIAMVGLWLVLRGGRRVWRMRGAAPVHDHTHDHHGHCETCGHAHGPTVAQVQSVASIRDAVAVVASIAIRPCTGALFLLILTHALGIDWAGITGAFIMGCGTATFTCIVAFASVTARESALAQIASDRGTAKLMAVAEVAAGAIIALLSIQVLF